MFLNEAKVKQYIPSSLLDDYSVIEMQESIAMDKYLKQILGSALIARLKTTDEDLKRDALRPFVERPLAFFTYLSCIPLMDLVHTEAGFAVVQNANMSPASKDRVMNFKNGILTNAYDGIESLLEYLEANQADFLEWQTSDTYKDIQGHFIDSAYEFDKYVRINRNRRTFLSLLPHVGDVELFRIESIVKDQYSKLLDETATDEVKTLLPYIKGAVCNLAIGKALDILALDITADGVMLSYEMGKNKPAEQSQIVIRQRAYIAEGEKYLAKLEEKFDLLFPDTLRETPYVNTQSNIFVG